MPLKADIYYRHSSEGDNETSPVILVHGAGGTHLHWPTQIRRLPGHRVYALDLPGHGKSEGRGNQTIESYCHSIIHWMEDIHLYRGVIVGHSMGGAIALTMAYKFPDRVVALVLIGSGSRLRVTPSILENSASQRTISIAIKTIMAPIPIAPSSPALFLPNKFLIFSHLIVKYISYQHRTSEK